MTPTSVPEWVYRYPSVSDIVGRNSDHAPSKTQTKTQTTAAQETSFLNEFCVS